MIVQGYAWYYFSGVRKTVDRIQEAIFYLDQARDNLSKRKLPSQVLWLLRRAVKSYLAFPGSNFVVDQVFDAVDDKVDAHADEANALIATAYTQIRDLIQQDGGKHVTQHTVQILGVLRNLKKQLQSEGLAEKYEVKERVNEASTAAAALLDVTKAKIQDSKLFGQLQQKVRLLQHNILWFSNFLNVQIDSSVRRKPVINNDLSPPPQPAADTMPSKSDDDGKSS